MRENHDNFDLSPHTRYYEDKLDRRRVRGRTRYLFIFFGLSVAALMVLASVLLLKITASLAG